MDDIRNWFNSKKNYSEGVVLYLKYGSDPMLIRLFQEEKQTIFKANKLASALEDILKGCVKQAKQIINVDSKPSDKVIKPDVSPKSFKSGWPEECDEILQTLRTRWREKYSEMTQLQVKVGDLAREGRTDPNKKEEAGRMALKILDLDEECDAIYHDRDFYIEHKKLPVETPPIEISLDPALWYKKLHNHQRYLRQFRKDLLKEPGNTDKAELLQKHEYAVKEYKKLLKMEEVDK